MLFQDSQNLASQGSPDMYTLHEVNTKVSQVQTACVSRDPGYWFLLGRGRRSVIALEVFILCEKNNWYFFMYEKIVFCRGLYSLVRKPLKVLFLFLYSW